MSAIICCTSWNAPIGRPNWTRSLAKRIAASSAASAMPSAEKAAMLRPTFRCCLAMAKASPGAPSRFSSGTSTLSKSSSPSGQLCMPIFPIGVQETPGIALSKTRQETPCLPSLVGVRTKTMPRSQIGPLVI
ncbi:hypothetical protein D3C81_1565800 [compost metagenome]